MTVLVIVEHHHGKLAAATRSVVTAALQVDSAVDLLVAGEGVADVVAQAAGLAGVAKVLTADGAPYAHGLAENMAILIGGLAADYSHILAPATTFGKDILPRLAISLDAPQISDVIEVVDATTFVHPIYAGNALETLQSSGGQLVLTVRPTAFAKAEDGGAAAVEAVAVGEDSGLSKFVGLQETKSDRPELASAERVVSGGRGVGGKDEFKVIYDFADAIGAAVGASRAAVDAGYIGNDHQVGQTGKVVAPQIYIAVGISGAIQHLAGMKDSKIIVAINKDENAPIFDVADYGLVADLFDALPELQQKLS